MTRAAHAALALVTRGLPIGLGEHIAVGEGGRDRLLEHLHPLDVVVARVREVGVPGALDLIDQVFHGLLHTDPRLEVEDPPDLLVRDPVAADEPVRLVHLEVHVDPESPERAVNAQRQLADAEVASLLRREPRLRAFIKKLPAAAGKTKWSNVSEFKSLGDVISFGFKAAKVEEAQIERHAQRVEAGDDASNQVFEFRRTSDSERDELEMHQ